MRKLIGAGHATLQLPCPSFETSPSSPTSTTARPRWSTHAAPVGQVPRARGASRAASWTRTTWSASAGSRSWPRTSRSLRRRRRRGQDQHHRHPGPRRLRRRGRAGADDGRRRAPARRRRRGPDAADAVRAEKALEHGLRPIVVINKIDRDDARIDEVLNRSSTCSSSSAPTTTSSTSRSSSPSAAERHRAATRAGTSRARTSSRCSRRSSSTSRRRTATRRAAADAVANLDYSPYLGRIAVGRDLERHVKTASRCVILQARRHGRERPRSPRSTCSRVSAAIDAERGRGRRHRRVIAGMEEVDDRRHARRPGQARAAAVLDVDEPALSMTFA